LSGSRKGNKIITVAGFVISILLLYLSLKDIRFREIWVTLANADWHLVFIPLFFIMIAVTLCAFRWSRVAGGGSRFRETFVALLIGLFINNVLPARIGEVARAYVLSKKRGFSFTYAISTVLVDRFFDLAGLLLITFIFFPRESLPAAVSKGLYMLIGLLVVCVVTLIVMSREGVAGKVADRIAKLQRPFFLKLAKRIIEIQENLKRINSPFNLVLCVCISAVTWLSMSTALYFVMLALGVPVRFAYIPFVCALLNMGLTIPSSPGYVGVYQFLLVYLLSIFGVPKYQGFAVSLVFHVSWYIPYNILGFTFSLREHLKIKEIRRLEEE
jgi:glycosyltransferase 2 family protein